MDIIFEAGVTYSKSRVGFEFHGKVDGEKFYVFIPDEVLNDHFKADKLLREQTQARIDIVEANRAQFEAMAIKRIQAGARGDILLATKDF